MTEIVSKQDSNRTELRYAVEISPATVDGSVSWIALEPNSYKGFGGEVKTKARMPINSSRQLKKGVVVDLDAMATFEQDFTYENFQGLAETFLCAAFRTKDELDIPVVDGTGNDYEPASGGAEYRALDLLFAKGFDTAANNGLKVVTGAPTATSVPVTDTGLVSESGQSGIISRVGISFASGLASINATASAFPRLEIANVAASGDLVTDTTNAADGSTVTIGGIVYTFETVLTVGSAGQVHVLIGANAAASLLNLARAINNSGGTPGTDYSTTGTGANPYVTSTTTVSGGTTITLTAIETGAPGNLIATTASTSPDSHIDPEAATLSGGAGRDLTTLGLIPGEFVFIGGDETNTAFALETSNGFCRIRSIEASALVFDKTQSIMVDDAGAGKTIRVYFGRVLKNESDPELIITRSLQLERTMGAPDADLPDEIQAEYLTRCLGDQAKLDCKTADIVAWTFDFMCNTNELREGSTGVKDGTRPELEDDDAFNSTSDIPFTKMAVVTDGDSCPTPLFAYFTDLQLTLKNNIKQNKAVSVLGTFDSTLGFFEVESTVTAYFQNVTALQSVQDNESVTLETHFVKFNQGVTIDLPLIVMGKAIAEVKINEPVMIPLKADAATAKIIDADLDHTMLLVFWDYLPDLAG